MKTCKQLTVDAPVASALRRLATGAFRGGTVHPNGDETFEIDDEVAASIERGCASPATTTHNSSGAS